MQQRREFIEPIFCVIANRPACFFIMVLVAIAHPLWSFPQTTAPDSTVPTSSNETLHPVGHGAFPVKVVRSLESSKLKSGDIIEFETESFKLRDGTVIPRGSKLMGRVVEARSRAKGDTNSELILTFDQLVVKNRKPLRLAGFVQAVSPPPDEYDPRTTGGPLAKESGVGLSGNVNSGSNTDSGSKPLAVAGPDSVGVLGMRDLQLKEGALSSPGKTVKLGVGVRIIVQVKIFG